jgi:hypothetical protein
MKTITPRDQRPPKLPKLKKAEEFPPVHFGVLHGRVIECFEAKVPVVHGGGVTVRGYGSSWVGTTVHDTLAAWFVDHQTGQQHKIDFGRDYLDMRYGHDVTMLWANDQLYAVANHTTQKIKYPALNRPILPQKKVGSGVGSIVLFLVLAVLGGIASLVLTISFLMIVPGPWWQQQPHYRHIYEQTSAASLVGLSFMAITILLVAVLPVALRARSNAKNRSFNEKQGNYVSVKLRQAEDLWIRQYAPPRIEAR